MGFDFWQSMGTGGFKTGGQQLEVLKRLAMARAQNPMVARMTGEAMSRQGQAQQLSLLAAARPGTQGLAQRTAAQQGSILQGQIAERTQAMALQEQMQNLGMAGNLVLGGRAQDLQAMGMPAPWERALGGLSGGAQTIAMLTKPNPQPVASDRRLKKNVEDGDDDVENTLNGLRAFRFQYKDQKFGSGGQVGVMAQDLEKTPVGKQVVVDTPAGKMVDGAKLATVATAAAANLHRRLKKLEKYDDEGEGAEHEAMQSRMRRDYRMGRDLVDGDGGLAPWQQLQVLQQAEAIRKARMQRKGAR